MTDPETLTIPFISEGESAWYVARWVLFLTHLYYDRGLSLVEDADYDQMCQELIEHWDDIPEHEQIMLGAPEELRHTGMGCAFSLAIIGQAEQLAKDLGEKAGPYTFKTQYRCECCGCRLTGVRG